MTITVVLTVGYSWIDGHLPVISDVGMGWEVAWKRGTIVLIGVSRCDIPAPSTLNRG
jgi:hypothetical protein